MICGENSNPLCGGRNGGAGTQIHAASWPNHFSRNEHAMVDAVTFATRSLSYKCSCFVLNACGIVSPEMRAELPYAEGDREFLEDPEKAGGSSIVGADSMVIAGPMPGDREGVLVADVDLTDCVRAKLVHDYSGHYNRADVFTLHVDRSVPAILPGEEIGAAPASAPPAADAGQGAPDDGAKPARGELPAGAGPAPTGRQPRSAAR